MNGRSDLVAYSRHDGLMDFQLPRLPKKKDDRRPEAIVLACASKSYFAGPLCARVRRVPLVVDNRLDAFGSQHAERARWMAELPEIPTNKSAIALRRHGSFEA